MRRCDLQRLLPVKWYRGYDSLKKTARGIHSKSSDLAVVKVENLVIMEEIWDFSVMCTSCLE